MIHHKTYSIQRSDFLDKLKTEDIIYCAWDYVDGVRWRNAFKWLSKLCFGENYNLNIEREIAPIWTWHSCGGWLKKPTVEDVYALYGLEKMRLYSFSIVEMIVPDTHIVFSSYEVWSNILEIFQTVDNPTIDSSLIKNLFDIEKCKNEEFKMNIFIQGTIPFIEKEWILEIEDLSI